MRVKQTIFVFILFNFLFFQISYSQKYNAIDKIVSKYPDFGSTEELAEKIEKDFTSEYDKARAIYSWIALNIDYDFKAFLNPPQPKSFSYRTEAEKQKKIKQFNDDILQSTFNSRKGVCEGFTLLFSHLASLTGLKSQIIKGDSKNSLSDIGRKKSQTNHAWNMVLITGKWRLIDATWGQGYYSQNKGRMVKDFTPIYFDTPPNYFFAKHFPESGTFLNTKLDKNAFLNGPLIYNELIEKDIEIVLPDSGVLEVKSGQKVTFRFKNISKSDQLYYLNKKNQPVKIENPKEKKGGLEFQVTFDKNIGQYITFYLNTNSLVSFKVVQK